VPIIVDSKAVVKRISIFSRAYTYLLSRISKVGIVYRS